MRCLRLGWTPASAGPLGFVPSIVLLASWRSGDFGVGPSNAVFNIVLPAVHYFSEHSSCVYQRRLCQLLSESGNEAWLMCPDGREKRPPVRAQSSVCVHHDCHTVGLDIRSLSKVPCVLCLLQVLTRITCSIRVVYRTTPTLNRWYRHGVRACDINQVGSRSINAFDISHTVRCARDRKSGSKGDRCVGLELFEECGDVGYHGVVSSCS